MVTYDLRNCPLLLFCFFSMIAIIVYVSCDMVIGVIWLHFIPEWIAFFFCGVFFGQVTLIPYVKRYAFLAVTLHYSLTILLFTYQNLYTFNALLFAQVFACGFLFSSPLLMGFFGYVITFELSKKMRKGED